MENMLSHGKGVAFFLHLPQGTLGAHQQLRVDITGCANMWGEYRDNLVCTVRACRRGMARGTGTCPWPSASQIPPRRGMVSPELGVRPLLGLGPEASS